MKKSSLNAIGLDAEKAKQLSGQLNELLAVYSIFYQNVRGYHWNINGHNFFELHVKFEELYNDLQVKIDEIAERILTLGQVPEHRYSAYKSASRVKESSKVTEGDSAVKDILTSFTHVITLQREILQAAEDANDEGTNALMSGYISSQEKLVWMYSAFLGKK